MYQGSMSFVLILFLGALTPRAAAAVEHLPRMPNESHEYEAANEAFCAINNWAGNSSDCQFAYDNMEMWCAGFLIDAAIPDPLPLIDEVLLGWQCYTAIRDCAAACGGTCSDPALSSGPCLDGATLCPQSSDDGGGLD